MLLGAAPLPLSALGAALVRAAAAGADAACVDSPPLELRHPLAALDADEAAMGGGGEGLLVS